jgi:heme exporter protein CcmD
MDWLDYGKHAPYVWSAVGLTAVVLLWNVIAARRRLASLTERTRRRLAAEETP